VSVERLNQLAAKPIYVEDRKFDLDSIIASIRLSHRRKGVRFVVIDYLGLIEVHHTGHDATTKYSIATRRIKLLAKELRIPIVMLAQLNRKLEHRDNKRPQLSDLSMSGSIEQDADVVLFLYRHEVYFPDDKKGLAEVIIAKQRNGPTCSVEVGYKSEQTRFVSRSEIPVDVDVDDLFRDR
jgi:replicative DNA helicase